MPRKNNAQFITKTCAHCGIAYTKPNWKVWRVGIYCSLDCYTLARRALPSEQRAALMAEATSRIRGSKRTHDDLCRRARTRQDRLQISGDEKVIQAALNAVGLFPIPLFAVDKFNIDFAFPGELIAIEYNGGNWHNTPAKVKADSIKADVLRGQGWEIIVFPRIDKPQNNDSGNARITIAEIVRIVQEEITLRRAE